MKIIYHSDDYGLTSCVTRRIADAWESGLLDGFSILANGDALEEGGAYLRVHAAHEARLGVHLNLYEGKALAPRDRVPLITDAGGNLNCSFSGLLLRWISSSTTRRRALISQVEHEWRLQIERVTDICAPRPIDVLDGHLHFHMLPFLFPIALGLAEEFGIGEIRIPREPLHISPVLSDSLSAGFIVNVLKNRILAACALEAKKTIRSTSVCSTDAFVGLLYTGRLSKSAVEAGIARCRRAGMKSVEVLFHIGRASHDEVKRWGVRASTSSFSTSPLRDIEYAALKELRGEAQNITDGNSNGSPGGLSTQ